jgi:short-subunit dehydrogenase
MRTETVLVTGASSGIGRELAKCFAADECQMILVSRKTDELEALAAELRTTFKIQAQVFACDLAEPEAPARLVARLGKAGIQVDVLVNNAGFGAQGKFFELDLKRQLDMVQVNVTALLHLTGLLLPGIVKRGHGGILNVASTASFQPGPGMAVYYATKAFVLSFSEAIAEELAGTSIIVSALCPGPTTTNFGKAAGGKFRPIAQKVAMTAESVARIGHRAYRRGKVVAVTGVRNKVVPLLVRMTPRATVRKIARRLNAVSP